MKAIQNYNGSYLLIIIVDFLGGSGSSSCLKKLSFSISGSTAPLAVFIFFICPQSREEIIPNEMVELKMETIHLFYVGHWSKACDFKTTPNHIMKT